MIPFNERLDKITERELVYDILNRLTWGRPITGANGAIYADVNTTLSDTLSQLAIMAAPTGMTNLSKTKTANLVVQKDSTAGVCSIPSPDGTSIRIVKAVSQQTGIDYTELCTTTTANNVTSIMFTCTAPMLHQEVIKVYYE